MSIVVLVKHVPDAQADRGFEPDHTTDRSVDSLLSELDEYAVEQALVLAATLGDEVVALTMGPDDATDAIKRALQMGADRGIHVIDDALAGSDALGTSRVLAAAIGTVDDVRLVVTGMSSTDGVMGVLPAMLAARLDMPALTLASAVSLDGQTLTIRRDTDTASLTVTADLPAVLSVTDQSGQPRFPNFKGIMAAKKKPVHQVSVADLGLDLATVGAAGAATVVESATARPPRQAGQQITDDGSAGTRLVEFLATNKLV